MDILIPIVKALHLISMAAWFGHKLLMPGDLRRTLESGTEAAAGLVPRFDKGMKFGVHAGLATLVTGFAMIFLAGGFGAIPPRIHIGIVLALGIFAIRIIVGKPAWKKTRTAMLAGQLDEARTASKRLSMVFGIEHLLWTATLVTMVFKF